MKNPQASALLQAVLGDMWQAIVSNPLSQGISLREISGFLQAALPELHGEAQSKIAFLWQKA